MEAANEAPTTTTPANPSEDAATKKQMMKTALLKELVRRKQELKMDQQLEELMEKYPEFRKGISHNKFGCTCLSANMLEKAEEHLV